MRLIILAGVLGMVFTLFFTPILIKALQRRGRTQAIRISENGINYPEHQNKIGTPSMGGVAILGGTVVGYAAAHLYVMRPPSYSVMLAFLLMGGLALVGFLDDYLKIYKQNSRGIRARTKLLGQAVVAVSFGYAAINGENANGFTPASTSISFVRDTLIVLPIGLFLVWVWFLVTSMTNAVNLTDGLDGLAAGASILTFAGYVLISVFQFNQSCAVEASAFCYAVRDPLDLAVFAAAIGGSLIGFLWWNTSPAKIFMGDTGSLALGGAIAALAIFTKTQLLMALMGGLFLIITVSVVMQVSAFKLTGRRVLKMAPLHHHFEMSGWPEIQIVVRFWVIQGIMLASALAIFYAEWVRFI